MAYGSGFGNARKGLINSLDAGNTGPHLTRAAYSDDNYRKLVTLKDKYDPANVFRFNHNRPITYACLTRVYSATVSIVLS